MVAEKNLKNVVLGKEYLISLICFLIRTKWKNSGRYVSSYGRNGKIVVDKFPHTKRGIRRTSYPFVPTGI